MTQPVALEAIQACLRGVIPSAFATAANDGTPNIIYLSAVHYVDSERVGLSRQFFNKTRANLDVNPPAGFEELFLEIGVPGDEAPLDPVMPSPEEFARLLAPYGCEITGPPPVR